MGNQTATESPNRLEIFWQDRSVKYTFPGGHYLVEELKTPWDLYVEGRYFNSPVGDASHQIFVKNGMERYFSIRHKEGIPVCDIITRPESAPTLSYDWGPRRIFRTSNPMTVDGQKLVVMEVISI